MEDKYLPIGTIVMLKNDIVLYMIVGYLNRSDNEEIRDYISIGFPYGMMTLDSVTYFNHDDIEKIVFLGYKNDKYELLKEKLKNIKGID